jgi:hypothetical protein
MPSTRLPLRRQAYPGPERPLEVSCSNCGARFVAYDGHDEETFETVEVRACGLCRGSEHKRDNVQGATIRLLAEVASRR